MHNLISKIQKTQVFPTLKWRTPTAEESQKLELEMLIGQGFVLRNPTIPFLPNAPQNGYGDHIPNTINPIICCCSVVLLKGATTSFIEEGCTS